MQHLMGTLVDGASFAVAPRRVEVASGTTVRWISHDISPQSHRVGLSPEGAT
jgi:plastocyanin